MKHSEFNKKRYVKGKIGMKASRKILSVIALIMFCCFTVSNSYAGDVEADVKKLKKQVKTLKKKVKTLQETVDDMFVSGLPPADYDSEWFFVEKNKNYDKTHNLETLPRLAVVWASSDSNGSDMYLMDGIHGLSNYSGYGSWLQRITMSSYRVSTGPYSAMSAYGVDNHWNWGNENGSGWIRILMWK
ncbi:hypothetical protein [Desulfonema magnum]|uniref:Uncharacterized protein n=1 Tax=Desulfonema magnum TaxID=45655 RepID=A0A975BUL6_9BACT|nr:hypothetical protein [Desulfonema magnum]QTA91787.1 Uncharacterized protein dnm_078610 [Desulfonema magnum]